MQGPDGACACVCPHLSEPWLQCKVSILPETPFKKHALTLFFLSRFVANLALISHKPTEDVKLSGEGNLKLNLPTLHGRLNIRTLDIDVA